MATRYTFEIFNPHVEKHLKLILIAVGNYNVCYWSAFIFFFFSRNRRVLTDKLIYWIYSRRTSPAVVDNVVIVFFFSFL